jgi:hypothetical protein
MADTRSRDRLGRLQAVQIIAMLPEDIEEARCILAHAGRLLDDFIAQEEKPPPVALLRPLVRPD